MPIPTALLFAAMAIPELLALGSKLFRGGKVASGALRAGKGLGTAAGLGRKAGNFNWTDLLYGGSILGTGALAAEELAFDPAEAEAQNINMETEDLLNQAILQQMLGRQELIADKLDISDAADKAKMQDPFAMGANRLMMEQQLQSIFADRGDELMASVRPPPPSAEDVFNRILMEAGAIG